MLVDEIKTRGLNVAEDVALPDVWRGHLSGTVVNVHALFATLLEQRSLVYHVLILSSLKSNETIPIYETETALISHQLLADSIASIAAIYSHKMINEVHLFLALLEQCPNDFEQQFAWLEECYIQRYPQGTPRRQGLLKAAKAAKNQWLASKVAESIERRRYGRQNIVENLMTYLSSMYYPFDAAKWREYERRTAVKHFGIEDAYALQGFAAHRVRNEVLK